MGRSGKPIGKTQTHTISGYYLRWLIKCFLIELKMSEIDTQQLLLRVKQVSKSFGGVHAVVDVDFELRQGELLGLIGPNGSGKTTLVNLITGFIRPDAGKIEFRGRDITGWMPYRIAR